MQGRIPVQGRIGASGAFNAAELNDAFEVGTYEADFDVATYYQIQGVVLPPTPFLGVVTYRFGLAEPAAHIHLPFKCTPWGCSCVRGGV